MENKSKQNRSYIIVIIIAVVFGIISGIVGQLLARVYLFDSRFNIPFFGEITFTGGSNGGSNLIISGARKVVVEQDTKVADTINSVSGSLAAIFKKQQSGAASDKINLADYYNAGQALGQGLIITSDGWIMTNFLPEELSGKRPEIFSSEIKANYVVITRDRKVFPIDDLVKEERGEFYFIHVAANDFPIRQFSSLQEVSNGQIVVSLDWQGGSWLTTISDNQRGLSGSVKSSDNFSLEYILADEAPAGFQGQVIFNLAGDVAALIDSQGRAEPISHYLAAIKSLLKYKEIKRASLGVNYFSLSDLIEVNQSQPLPAELRPGALIYPNSQGVAIIKNSAADLAGLKEGDIITMINNIPIDSDNDLAEVLGQFLAGDKIKIIYWRGGNRREQELELAEKK